MGPPLVFRFFVAVVACLFCLFLLLLLLPATSLSYSCSTNALFVVLFVLLGREQERWTLTAFLAFFPLCFLFSKLSMKSGGEYCFCREFSLVSFPPFFFSLQSEDPCVERGERLESWRRPPFFVSVQFLSDSDAVVCCAPSQPFGCCLTANSASSFPLLDHLPLSPSPFLSRACCFCRSVSVCLHVLLRLSSPLLLLLWLFLLVFVAFVHLLVFHFSAVVLSAENEFCLEVVFCVCFVLTIANLFRCTHVSR